MSNRNLSKAIQGLSQEISKLCRSMTKQVINWLLRAAFVVHRPSASSSGFVLPTTVLLILVVSLSVGALTYRAFTRNTQVITQSQQRVIYNAATPAIDRARSKLEFMFDQSKDNRYPSGVIPKEDKLLGMLLNDGSYGENIYDPKGTGENPYLLPDEKNVDLPNTPTVAGKTITKDPAWSFETDMDGDGKNDATVVYSILFRTPPSEDKTPSTPNAPKRVLDFQKVLVEKSDREKAAMQVVRHGPLTTETGAACKVTTASTANKDPGWFEDPANTSVVRKNFQVDVLVIPYEPKVAAVTLEFQQDREISKGNKWAAWFRNDLEISPGAPFRWNGAMHTEGNLIVGNSGFKAYLISSTESCLYPPVENSEITVTKVTKADVEGDFTGTVALGKIGSVAPTDPPAFDVHYQGTSGYQKVRLDIDANNSGTAKKTLEPATLQPIYSDPVAILLQDKRKTAEVTDSVTTNVPNVNWKNLPDVLENRRLRQNPEPTPYIDDLYRADNRWGPKPKYDTNLPPAGDSVAPGKTPERDDVNRSGFGYPIIEPRSKYLIDDTPRKDVTSKKTDRTNEAVGNDGYWERRARNEGLRVIVGERLEMGNLFGWTMPHDTNGDKYIDPTAIDPTTKKVLEDEGDPLYPPEVAPYPVRSGAVMTHLDMQRRTLRDNLAAVQATAIYHVDQTATTNATIADYPVACLASTSHPGTPTTLRDSIDFVPTQFKDKDGATQSLMTDFFMGRGTNGWEFEPPQQNAGDFELALASGRPLRIALENLSHFAGDPEGAFPPRQNSVMHPYPALTMWGNFSNLRRALDTMTSGVAYSNLSIADKTYIQTASCTLGMMAYNIDMVQKFDPEKSNEGLELMQDLGADLYSLMNGDLSDNGPPAAGGGEVLPDTQIKSYRYKRGGSKESAYEPRDYYDVPPEAYIAALRQKYTVSMGVDAVNEDKLRLAEMLMMKYQLRRDRTFGFRPSPFFGHYAVTKAKSEKDRVRVFPTACDPNELLSLGVSTNPTTDLARQRLGLSRLCGALKIPSNYDLSKPLVANASLPVVMPKFPALYYLFPEQKHNLEGTSPNNFKVDPVKKVPVGVDEYDTRQPSGTPTATSTLTDEARADVLFTDNKFVEPYVSVAYNKTAMGGYEFLPVQATSPSPTRKPAPSTYYNSAITDAPTIAQYDLAGVPPISEPNALSGSIADTLKASIPATNRSPFPIAETAVNLVAVQPRTLNGVPATGNTWKLPAKTDRIGSTNKANTPTNIILVPTAASGFGSPISSAPVAVPFLDRAIFDARQVMLTRVLDMDIGLMRSESIPGGEFTEPLLPMSGIVYAFREDAVREDAIARPADSVNNRMSAIDPANPVDPLIEVGASQKLASTATGLVGISTKPVDYLPDPERRVHGFRIRNAVQVKRNTSKFESGSYQPEDNYRGLSLFTDQPLYIQGDTNLHQDGADDTIGQPLEEFTKKIRGTAFGATTFYDRGKGGANGTQDTNFAKISGDRWRPTEFLSDAITILSDNFCDGSASDVFVNYQKGDYNNGRQHTYSDDQSSAEFDRGIYHDNKDGNNFKSTGLYSPGCLNKASSSQETGITSFRNSDQPMGKLPEVSGAGLFDWVRENQNPTSYSEALRKSGDYNDKTAPAGDYLMPIKISRSGLPIVRQALAQNAVCPDVAVGTKQACNPLPEIHLYSDPEDSNPDVRRMKFRSIGENGLPSGTRTRLSIRPNNVARDITINSIVVSGITPSKQGQTYGGLHNFPRFLENYDNRITLDYAGSFLQLSFSNYATAPFEVEGWEYKRDGTLTPPPSDTQESLPYYLTPKRAWGYDVALQLAAAGPAASRFVIPRSSRNEFYSEPQINDPYIQTLCQAAKAVTPKIKGADKLNCTN